MVFFGSTINGAVSVTEAVSGVSLTEQLFGPFSTCNAPAGANCTAQYAAPDGGFSSSPISATQGSITNLLPFEGDFVDLSRLVETTPVVEVGTPAGSPTTSWVASGNLNVTYTYDAVEDLTPVPLPAGVLLFLTGLGTLGVARLRRA